MTKRGFLFGEKMGEILRHDDEYEKRQVGLKELVAEYFVADDAEFIDGMDNESEQIGYVYGLLLGLGEDPDEVLQEFGVTEGDSKDEI